MEVTDVQISEYVTIYAWPFLRIAAFLIALPVVSSGIVPAYIKTGLAIFIAILIAPGLPRHEFIDVFSLDGLIISVVQIIIGLALGFIVKIVFSAMETGGYVIGQTMGLGFAQMNDPANGVTVPVISQFYTVLATLIFLILNGHLIMIDVLASSFNIIPITAYSQLSDGVWKLILWSGWIFTGAVLIALPAVGALLLVNIAFGVMMRAAPQLNIFTIGFPISLMLGLLFIMFTLPVFSNQFISILDNTVMTASNLFR